MKHVVTAIVFLSIHLLIIHAAMAERELPFGFEMQRHPLTYPYCRIERGLTHRHNYFCSLAPKPHPYFGKYILEFIEDIGLCSITAIREEPPGSLGDEQFEKLKNQIETKYGVRRRIPTDRFPSLGNGYMWAGKDNVNLIILSRDDSSPRNTGLTFSLLTGFACKQEIEAQAERAF